MTDNTIYFPSQKVGLSGRYMMATTKLNRFGKLKETSRRIVAPWFPNLITDFGLNQYGDTNGYIQYCHVGTGATAPAVGDTTLATYLAGVSRISGSRMVQGSAPYYGSNLMHYRFGAGVAEGNIAEVGASDQAATGNLYSRALILDGGGSPTTITVQSDEVLDVYYEPRIYPPLSDTSGTVLLDGETFDWTGRASLVTTGFAWGFETDGATAGNASGSNVSAYSGTIGAITASNSGSSSAGALGVLSYSSGSHEREFTGTWGLTAGNVGGIRSIGFQIGMGRYQVEFSRQGDSAAIPKDGTKVLVLNFKHSWARQ